MLVEPITARHAPRVRAIAREAVAKRNCRSFALTVSRIEREDANLQPPCSPPEGGMCDNISGGLNESAWSLGKAQAYRTTVTPQAATRQASTLRLTFQGIL